MNRGLRGWARIGHANHPARRTALLRLPLSPPKARRPPARLRLVGLALYWLLNVTGVNFRTNKTKTRSAGGRIARQDAARVLSCCSENPLSRLSWHLLTCRVGTLFAYYPLCCRLATYDGLSLPDVSSVCPSLEAPPAAPCPPLPRVWAVGSGGLRSRRSAVRGGCDVTGMRVSTTRLCRFAPSLCR